MAEHVIRFERGLTLEQALALIEDESIENVREVAIFPPVNACTEVSDEDSGKEDFLDLNNLPGAQLQAPAEIQTESTDEYSSEDDLPLSILKRTCQNYRKKNNLKKKKIYNWVKEDLILPSIANSDMNLKYQSSSLPVVQFCRFFDDEVLDLIVNESNRYAAQKNRKTIIEKSEIKSFIGILILSGYICVPRRRMYWERERDSHNDLVAEAMTRDKFEYIMTNLHVSDNTNLDPTDRFAKVRPLFTLLNRKFIENACISDNHSVDEAMVPYFGRHGCKQFIHGKPIRYGYKLWVGTTKLGYVNWFEPYQGASTTINQKYAEFGVGPAVVLTYADVLKTKWENYKMHIYFDNFFSTIPLFEELSKKGFYATGTIRENRIYGKPLLDTKFMKKEKRGTYDYKKITDENIIVLKWHDNSVVSLCSNYAGILPIHSAKRYSQKEKKNIQIDQPHAVCLYNNNMGGVDRCDQNISLYRISIRGKKWYFPLLAHCIDLCVQNAWHLHRQDGGDLDQLAFRRIIATVLLTQNKKINSYSKGKPSRNEGHDVRFDGIDHLVIPQPKQTRCRHCHERTTTRCKKCDVGLHVKCFVLFHTKSN